MIRPAFNAETTKKVGHGRKYAPKGEIGTVAKVRGGVIVAIRQYKPLSADEEPENHFSNRLSHTIGFYRYQHRDEQSLTSLFRPPSPLFYLTETPGHKSC